MNKSITVTQLNTYIKALLDESVPLKSLFVVGEISNFKHHYSGHMYFTLKDSQTQIKAVMFSSAASRLKFMVEDGMKVICRGRVSVYEKSGMYQLYVEDMQPDGIGALNLAYEQLKEKLSAEGLFDPIHKKPIPKFPRKIGVATSNTGAAIEDIKNITARRYPLCELVIAPTIVQGEQAGNDIIKSIKLLDSIDDVDVIIVGRGGGSIEDLWAFNLESVARAVFYCETPIISAVGHETDFTICDFVADLRAPTPSAAAELAVPDINQLSDFVKNTDAFLRKYLKGKVENEMQRFDCLAYDSVLGRYNDYFKAYNDDIISLSDKLNSLFSLKMKMNDLNLRKIAGKLDALSPLAVISRGYAVVKNESNAFIKSAVELKQNDKLNLRFKDGCAECTVNEVKYEQ